LQELKPCNRLNNELGIAIAAIFVVNYDYHIATFRSKFLKLLFGVKVNLLTSLIKLNVFFIYFNHYATILANEPHFIYWSCHPSVRLLALSIVCELLLTQKQKQNLHELF